MKILFASIMMLVGVVSTQAQFSVSNFSVSASGNYTMYKGDFRQNTPGVKLGLGYAVTEKARVELAYTHNFPIRVASYIDYQTNSTNGSVDSELKFDFGAVSLTGSYCFINTEEDKFSLYGQAGISLVFVKYKEEPKTPLPSDVIQSTQAFPGKDNGLCGNLAIGAQYNLGPLKVFGDAGLAFPNNSTDNYYYVTYNYNPIPFHFLFNVGLRVPFGKHESKYDD